MSLNIFVDTHLSIVLPCAAYNTVTTVTPAVQETSWWSQFFKRGGSTHQAAQGQAKPRKVRSLCDDRRFYRLTCILLSFL